MSEQEDRVRERAHRLWENEGRPEGRDLHHWLKAEEETGGEPSEDVAQAAGPSHGDEDFGAHDNAAEDCAISDSGSEQYASGVGPKRAGADGPGIGEQQGQPRLSPAPNAQPGEKQ